MENKFSDELISNYRDDLDFQHVVDLVQTVSKVILDSWITGGKLFKLSQDRLMNNFVL